MSRGPYDTSRADMVMRFCWQPRTLEQVRRHFADEPIRAEWALFNLLRSGKVRRTEGRYVSVYQQAPGSDLANIWRTA